jgi:phage shock protein A
LDKARKENRTADIENWEAVVKSLSATVTAGEEELMTRWSESLQSAADVFGEAVDSIMDKFESAMSGISGSFEELQMKFSQRSEERDRYLADYERVYELSKLSRDINKSIDTSDSARAASKLKDIQEEVYAL